MDRKLDATRNLFEEPKKLNILVKDKNREAYMVPKTAFDVGMLDLTHPHTASWFKEILQELVDDGEDPISSHNRYPELWAQINRKIYRRMEKNSPKRAMLFWEGDQMVSWQANDGIKSGVVGLLSSGLCGYAFNHSDIGSYCVVNLPFFKYRRDASYERS
ncbi:hypothetical protein L1887_30402 [Cichorium endivia]|nr:hypothetical protein L1887_30402 [Cichorium endivia]